jgi:hypothetical protein
LDREGTPLRVGATIRDWGAGGVAAVGMSWWRRRLNDVLGVVQRGVQADEVQTDEVQTRVGPTAEVDRTQQALYRRLYDYDFDDDGSGSTAPTYFDGGGSTDEGFDGGGDSTNSTWNSTVAMAKCPAPPFTPAVWPDQVKRATLGQCAVLSMAVCSLVAFIRLLLAIYTCAAWGIRNEGGVDIITSCLELALWLGCAYTGEHLMPRAPRSASSDMFFAVCLVAVLVSFCRVKTVQGALPLSRDQTNEWRGWMQIAFCMFHYANYDPVYVPIRAFVACYVWQVPLHELQPTIFFRNIVLTNCLFRLGGGTRSTSWRRKTTASTASPRCSGASISSPCYYR